MYRGRVKAERDVDGLDESPRFPTELMGIVRG